MRNGYVRLGDYIRQVDNRNKSLITSNLLGINIDKQFMPSVANIIGTDLSCYKLLFQYDFAFNPMHVGRDERIPIALYLSQEAAIVSPAYITFKIDSDKLLSKYLMLWFRRSEFDRECWFYADASVRGGITWEDFCDLLIPLPSIEEQKRLVNTYEAIEGRIALKRKINDNLELQAETVFNKKIIKNNLYPFNESLDKNINFINGLAMQNFRPKEGRKSYPVIKIRELTQGFCDNSSEYCHTDIGESHTVNKGDLVFSWSGSLQAAFWTSETCGLNQHLFKVVSYKYPKWLAYMWVKYHLLSFQRIAENKGTTFGHIKREDLHNAQIKSLDFSAIESYDKIFSPIVESIIANATELHFLMKLQRLVLSQLSR